jgi:hypothetical protein
VPIIGTWEAEAGGLGVQGCPGLPRKFESTLGYIVKHCLKTNKQKKPPKRIILV